MSMKYFILYFLFFMYSNYLFSQNKKTFYEVVEKGKVLKSNKKNKKELTFLGSIRDSSDNILYYVVTNIEIVKAFKVSHGHIIVFFLDSKYNVVRRFELGHPNEMPYKLEANVLYFYCEDEKGNDSIYQNIIGTVLPAVLCVSLNNCY